ncbi:MAG: hypothetical protein QOJ03_1791, partial [Frankiaceae bacterium]|nr:hypothetical protein [Frankiaceae bacterium]
IGLTIWRVSTARSLATRAGLDPNEATAVTLLSDDGLGAAYLASSLRQPSQQPAVPSSATVVPAQHSAEDRLRELAGLKAQGLVTADEYDARRKAILDAL